MEPSSKVRVAGLCAPGGDALPSAGPGARPRPRFLTRPPRASRGRGGGRGSGAQEPHVAHDLGGSSRAGEGAGARRPLAKKGRAPGRAPAGLGEGGTRPKPPAGPRNPGLGGGQEEKALPPGLGRGGQRAALSSRDVGPFPQASHRLDRISHHM